MEERKYVKRSRVFGIAGSWCPCAPPGGGQLHYGASGMFCSTAGNLALVSLRLYKNATKKNTAPDGGKYVTLFLTMGFFFSM